jgi:CubicO group peptidase (beta-lactamase class C family)
MADLPAHAAASLRTPLGDYAHFAERLCSGEGLSAAVYEDVISPHNPVDPGAYGGNVPEGELHWGLGIGRQDHSGETVLFHWGDNGAFKAFLAINPETERGIIYFANAQGGLKLIRTLSEPVVGDVSPIVAWLDYGDL